MSYDHRHHAGNIGDVWKHVVWLSLLAAFKRVRIAVVDHHAGRGLYMLDPGMGEWRAGIGRLRERHPEGASTGSGAVDRYLARVGRTMQYPGSPLLTLRALGRADRLTLYESDAQTANALREAVDRDDRARIVAADGWSAPEIERPSEVQTLLLADPPFNDKADWDHIAEVLGRGYRAGHVAAAWYPIKRLTRPSALHRRLQERGVPHVALELLLTPIERTGERMAGSGMLLVSAPESVVIEACAAAPVLGAALATAMGQWSFRALASAHDTASPTRSR